MSLIPKIFYSLSLKCAPKNRRSFEGNFLRVQKAPHPSEIYWGNLGYNYRKKIFLGMCAWLKVLMIVVISYMLLLFFWFLRWEVTEYAYYLAPFTIVITNIVVEKISVSSTKYEKHENFTQEQLSIATKVATLIIPNSIFPLLLIFRHFKFDCLRDYYVPGGFLYDAYSTMFGILFLDPLLRLLDVNYFLKKYRRWKEKKKNLASNLT